VAVVFWTGGATVIRRAAQIALLASLLGATGAFAATPSTARLADPAGQVRWQGAEFQGPASPPRPETCATAECDEFTLRLRLPARTFRRPGGVQVGIRWRDENQDADLFVFDPDGVLAAKSDGFFASTAESVQLDRPANGEYRVVVVPRFTNGEPMAYEGQAQVERPARRRPVRRLLPDLVAQPPRHLSFSIGGYLFDPGVPTDGVTSCYPEEVLEDGASRCMRFDQIVANFGDGPFELRYRMEGVATDQQLRQRIYRSDGSYRDRLADTYEFHAAHAHFHYKNFAVSRMWAADARGRKTGERPVRTGDKNGFCMIDVENSWFGRIGDAARAYYFPRCNAPTERDESGTYMTNGISVGWADVYNWYLADQYIEVSGVPDGCYMLVTEADPRNTILERDEHNNLARALLSLDGDSGRFIRRARASEFCG
jgi:hypothetical protein